MEDGRLSRPCGPGALRAQLEKTNLWLRHQAHIWPDRFLPSAVLHRESARTVGETPFDGSEELGWLAEVRGWDDLGQGASTSPAARRPAIPGEPGRRPLLRGRDRHDMNPQQQPETPEGSWSVTLAVCAEMVFLELV